MDIHIETMKELSEAGSLITYVKGSLTAMNQLMTDDNPAKNAVSDLLSRVDDHLRQSSERAKLLSSGDQDR